LDAYTAGLARDAKARKAAESGPVAETSVPAPVKAPRVRKGGPVGEVGSEPAGPAEVVPGGRKRRIASTSEVNPDQSSSPAVDGGGQSPD
jgi:hypothetical protein